MTSDSDAAEAACYAAEAARYAAEAARYAASGISSASLMNVSDRVMKM